MMIMKKHLLLFAMILLPLVASAHDIEVQNADGVTIYYNYINGGNELEVTYRGDKHDSYTNEYHGIIVIPEKVTYINGTRKVTRIGSYAFYKCNLVAVTIPNSVTSIGNNAFFDCDYLTSITIPNSVTSIGERAFEGCSGLTSITIPNSVTSIGYWAFRYCFGLTSVTIGSGVTSIGEKAFEGCKHLTSITIPNSVTSIGYSAFSNCTSLTSVTIPNSVTFIGGSAFYGCSGLTSVTIGNSVTSIGSYAFSGCSGLTSITIPNSVTSIGYSAFSNCTSLTSVTIPNSVTSIGDYAFNGCSGLTSITIPNSVTSIGDLAFYKCTSLTSITIGSEIKYINIYAFASCPELTDVTCYAENVPSTEWNAFKDSNIEYATLHVPASAVNAYKEAYPWNNFKSVTAIGGDTPETPKCEKPTISYQNGKLTFSCATEGATCQYTIADTDIKAGSGHEVQLGVTYNISVYATKSGYDNSETATATLCWIDQQPKTEGITNGIANIPAQAVLIQSEGGAIHVQGVDEGTQVNVYSVNGTQAGSAISQAGAATINTNLQPGSIAIVKIGQKSVKVVMK